MKKTQLVLLALTFVFGLSTAAVFADGPECGAQKKDGKVVKTCDSSKGSCELGVFPAMVMKVGEKSYQCPMEAGKEAESSGGKIAYWVNDKSYSDKNEAMIALAGASETYVEDYTRIGCLVDGKVVFCAESAGGKNCPAKGTGEKAGTGEKSCGHAAGAKAGSGEKTCGHAAGAKAAEGQSKDDKGHKFYVLGREFKTWDEAVKARDEALTAMKKVKMTYLVDGKEVDSCEKVCPKAKAEGKVQFVVGETKTNCESTARYTLARNQYETARGVGEKLAKL